MSDVKKLAEQAGASLHVTTLEGSTMWVASGDALTRFAALVRQEVEAHALRQAASRVRNATHTCMSEQHCDFLHAAHERVAQELEAEAAALDPKEANGE